MIVFSSFCLVSINARIPVKEIDNYRLSLDWQKGEEAATPDLPNDSGLDNIVIGKENFVKKTGLDAVHCGEKVTGTIKLTSNLNCPNHGLIIGNNTVVNMDGYSIRGPGQESSKVGLVIPNNDNVVVQGPGDISNFQAGILVKGANHVNLSSLILEQNKRGLYLQNSDYLHIEQYIIKDNEIGIASKSDNHINITSNLLNGNVLAGVAFVNTHDSTVFENNIYGSQNGVFADAQSLGNAVAMNNILHNAIDINNANGISAQDNNNHFSDNNCQVNNPRLLC